MNKSPYLFTLLVKVHENDRYKKTKNNKEEVEKHPKDLRPRMGHDNCEIQRLQLHRALVKFLILVITSKESYDDFRMTLSDDGDTLNKNESFSSDVSQCENECKETKGHNDLFSRYDSEKDMLRDEHLKLKALLIQCMKSDEGTALRGLQSYEQDLSEEHTNESTKGFSFDDSIDDDRCSKFVNDFINRVFAMVAVESYDSKNTKHYRGANYNLDTYGLDTDNVGELKKRFVIGGAFPNLEDARTMQFQSKYIYSETDFNEIGRMFDMAIQFTEHNCISSTGSNSYKWDHNMMDDFNKVHTVVYESLREICSMMFDETRGTILKGDRNVLGDIMDRIIRMRTPCLITSYVERFGGIFAKNESFLSFGEKDRAIKSSLALSYLYSAFRVKPFVEKNEPIKRYTKMGHNSYSFPNSVYLYKIMKENTNFQNFLSKMACTSLDKEGFSSILKR